LKYQELEQAEKKILMVLSYLNKFIPIGVVYKLFDVYQIKDENRKDFTQQKTKRCIDDLKKTGFLRTILEQK
jgi:hypothetical protein